MLSEKQILNETKNHNPPPPFKLNGRSLSENDTTVCYFNKVRYLFGMNNQLTLPRTEKLLYFKITSS